MATGNKRFRLAESDDVEEVFFDSGSERYDSDNDSDYEEDLAVVPVPTVLDKQLTSEPRTKIERSSINPSPQDHMLSKRHCVICRKKKYLKRHRAHKPEHLTKTVTLDGAGLYGAAEIKEDQPLLMLFKGGNAVAMEVHYHKSCHAQYVNSVRNKLRPSTRKNFSTATPTWKRFLSLIEEKIVLGKCCYSRTHLVSVYQKMCRNANEADNHTNQWLLYQLKRVYGARLVFHRPSKVTESLLIASKDAKQSDLVCGAQFINIDDEDTENSSDEESPSLSVSNIEKTEECELFHTAMKLQEDICQKKLASRISWPLLPSELIMQKCQNPVPESLFNFLAYVVGAADKPPELSQFCDVEEEAKLKIVSIVQDIMSLQSKGAAPTPTSPAVDT